MYQNKNKIAVDTYEKIASIYSKEYFEDLSDAYYLDKFLELIPKKGKILDVGSGPGQFSKYIKEKNFEITGIDFSEQMIKIAREKVSGVEFDLMDMRNLKFKENNFEGLLSAYSLIHVPSNEIVPTLKGFRRVLKPGGLLEIIAQKGKANQVVDELFMPGEKMFFNFFSKDRIKKYLERSGFDVIFQEEKRISDQYAMGNTVIYTIARKSE